MLLNKQIIPAVDWFYIDYIQNNITIYHLAAWSLLENGSVVGLISVSGSNSFDDAMSTPRLVGVPPSKTGTYKHRDELSNDEKNALSNDGLLKLDEAK